MLPPMLNPHVRSMTRRLLLLRAAQLYTSRGGGGRLCAPSVRLDDPFKVSAGNCLRPCHPLLKLLKTLDITVCFHACITASCVNLQFLYPFIYIPLELNLSFDIRVLACPFHKGSFKSSTFLYRDIKQWRTVAISVV
jgi:hypothetical protein